MYQPALDLVELARQVAFLRFFASGLGLSQRELVHIVERVDGAFEVDDIADHADEEGHRLVAMVRVDGGVCDNAVRHGGCKIEDLLLDFSVAGH